MNENSGRKYACEDILGGVRRERAFELLLATCNQAQTLFITDGWVAPRLEKLRRLLSDPITNEQSQALRDAAMKRMRLDGVIVWLELGTMSLADYVRVHRRIAAEVQEAEKNRKKERRQEWMEQLRKQRKPACPTCDKRDAVVPIIYGYVSLIDIKDDPPDCYVLGGCVIGEDSYRWWCRRCDAGFGTLTSFWRDE